ncbi:MAG: amino acid adenylation domain-containing protein [Cyclobacteriaceae bacterium]
MNIGDYLWKLRNEHGISVYAQDGDLRIKGSEGSLMTEIVDELRNRKDDILTFFIQIESQTATGAINKIEEKSHYILSSVQRRLYFLFELDKLSLAYNMPQIVEFEGEVDKDKLEKAFKRLIFRHESLRTSFEVVRNEVYQKISDGFEFEIEYHESDELEAEVLVSEFIRPFDLNKGPLIRVGLVKLSTNSHLLMVDMHHIIADGVSQGILIRDFMSLYNEEQLPEIALQYKDYAEWQQSIEQKTHLSSQREFWLNEFEEDATLLDLPTDFPRPLIKTYKGSCVRFSLSKEETEQLKLLGEQAGATMFMTILSIFNILLSKLSNQDDIVVGTSGAGRLHADLEDIIGMFVNTFALRNRPIGPLTFEAFLLEVKAKTIACFDNQNYQYEELVEELNIEREMNRNPLFDVMFDFTDNRETSLDIEGITLKPYDFSHNVAKFDLRLFAQELSGLLYLGFDYSTELFLPGTIERIITYFKNIVTAVIAQPSRRISSIDILSEEEKRQLLIDFNNTTIDYPSDKTIIDLFEAQVAKVSGQSAVVHNDRILTYKDLNALVNQLSHYLCDKHSVTKGVVVGVMIERSIEAIVSMLAIMKLGGTYLPIDPSYPENRKCYILENSQANVLLTGSSMILDIVSMTEVFEGSMLFVDDFLENPTTSKENLGVKIDPINPAYMIYTSGSTGVPKGVVVAHGSIVNMSLDQTKNLDVQSSDQVLQFSSLSFDASIFEIFMSIFGGATLILVDNEIVKDSEKFLGYLKRHSVSIATLPPSYLSTLPVEELSFLRILITAGEPADVVKAVQCSKILDYYNAYGPTECAVCVSAYKVSEADHFKHNLPIGKPVSNTKAYILDSAHQLVPVGVAGELCISGVNLALGYHRDDAKTKGVFMDNPYGEDLYGRIYKTGDLARWLPNGNLEYLGRLDDQVKIRGFRIELGEIKHQLVNHEKICDAVVVAKEKEKYLVGYYVSESEISQKALHIYLSGHLPGYMIPAFFIHMESLPLTSNGKINKKALPDPEIVSGEDYVAPSNEIEEKLTEIWSDSLGVERVGIEDNFFGIGGDSIKVISLANRINQTFSITIDVADVFANQTIKELSALIDGDTVETKDKFSIKGMLTEFTRLKEEVLNDDSTYDKENIEDVYPMSDIQQGMVFHTMKDQGVYHDQMAHLIQISQFDSELFKKALELLSAKHSILRTSFSLDQNEKSLQLVYKSVEVDYTYLDLSDLNVSEQKAFIKQQMEEDRERSFVFHIPGLWRYKVYSLGDDYLAIYLICHHAIIDGWSDATFSTELHNTYFELVKDCHYTLSPLKSSYKDYIIEQQLFKRNRDTEEFWQKELSDFDRFSFSDVDSEDQHKILSEVLSDEFSQKIYSHAKERNINVKSVFHSAFLYCLRMFSYDNDLTSGLISNSRPVREDSERVLGCFLTMVPFRFTVPENITWIALCHEVHEKLNMLRKYDRISLNSIVKIIDESIASENRISDVFFNFVDFHVYDELNVIPNETEIQDLKENKYHEIRKIGNGLTNFKFDFTVNATGGVLSFSISYFTSFISERCARDFQSYFNSILYRIVNHPDEVIDKNEILAKERSYQIEHELDHLTVDYPKDKTVIDLFENQVKKTPDHVALVFEGEEISYKELDEKSNRLAHLLRENDVGKDQIVGLLMDRSIDTVVGMLSILKAGGAYLPMDVGYPEKLIAYFLKDSEATLLLTNKATRDSSEYLVKTIAIEDAAQMDKDIQKLDKVNGPSDLCYIIYTSGTTGNPKGVMIEHRNVVRLFFNDKFQFDFGSEDVWTMFHGHTFDFSVWEMYGALLFGGKLVIIPKMVARDPGLYLRVLKVEGVTILNQTPSAFYNLIEAHESEESNILNLRYVIFGGEALSPSKLKPWKSRYPGTKLVNMFGITETTVHVTYKEITDYEIIHNIGSIGGPLPTSSVYLLDADQNLIPSGAKGELYVGGAGIARGYLNNDELTAEKFIKHPFKVNERLYRTGDFARWLSNGNLEYLGRLDDQVKIRGHRIELREIAHQLLNHESISDAVVLVKESEGEKYLVSYYVSDEEIDTAVLRNYLSRQLPEYMLPSYYIYTDGGLPLTRNGKIDKKSLPVLRGQAGVKYKAPQTTEEQILCKVWSRVLGVERVGITDNFFALGGDSIKAIRLTSQTNKALNTTIGIADLFTSQNIQALADGIKKKNESSENKNLIREIEHEFELWKGKVMHDNNIFDKENIIDVYPMSDIQKGMVFHSIKKSGVYHDQILHVAKINNFDLTLFHKSLELMVEKHPILRTSFLLNQFEEFLQLVYGSINVEIQDQDISSLNLKEQRIFIESDLYQDRVRPLDFELPGLWRFKVYNLGNDFYVLCFICHHSIIDGWSDASFNTELNNIYLTLQQGKEYLPTTLKSSYRDYVIEEQISNNRKDVIDFWKQELLNYSRYSFEDKDEKDEHHILGNDFSEEFSNRLIVFGKERGVSVKSVCYAAFLSCLDIFTYESDITIGLITSNRPAKEDGDKILGCFLNTVPFRFVIPENVSGEQLVFEVQDKLNLLKKYDSISLAKVQEILGEIASNQNPITDIIFNYIDFHIYEQFQNQDENGNVHLEAIADKDFSLDNHEGVRDNSRFSFTLDMTRKRLFYSISYSSNFVSTRLAKSFQEYFRVILERIVEHPNEVVNKNDILSDLERHQLLYEFNNTEVDYPTGKTITDLIEEQATRVPKKVAVKCGRGILTYEDLNNKSNALAYSIRNKGIGKDVEFIPILMNKCLEYPIAVLATLKLGLGFAPLDIKWPIERKKEAIKGIGSNILLGGNRQQNINDKYLREILIVVDCGELPECNENPSHAHNLNSPIYVIHTSGSSGKPKGAINRHSGILNRFYYMNRRYGVRSEDVILMTSNIAFDSSVWQLLWPLINGTTTVIPKNDNYFDSFNFLNLIEEEKITITDFVPSVFNGILESIEVEDNQTIKKFETLRQILMGGEAISPPHVNKFKTLFPEIGITNAYGPCEASIGSVFFEVDVNSMDIIPIGKPIDNVKCLVLDKYGKLVPRGVGGELYLGGACTGLGYLNNSELTSKSFMRFHFDNYESTVFYKTGDLVKYQEDGNLIYLGRLDDQVKIRGFRIELEEIEHHLLNQNEILEVVVLAKERGGDKYLVCYYVSRAEIDTAKIRNYLLTKLPDYMVPSFYVQIESLPLTLNGKVDKKLLPDPEIETGEPYVTPSNKTEEELVKIWGGVLKIDKKDISVTDNFFELGGHSLLATVLVNKIYKRFKVKISLINVFSTPTVRELAKKLESIHLDDSFEDELVVLLKQTSNSDHKLFLIHDGSGDVQGYLQFSALIETYNCWGIRSSTLNGFIPKNLTVEELARSYITKLKTLQPQGPYRIAGWSFGGIIAHEIASQLESIGDQVDFLLIFDSVLPVNPEKYKSNTFSVESERQFLSEVLKEPVKGNGKNISTIWKHAIKFIEKEEGGREKLIAKIPEEFRDSIPHFESLDIEHLVIYGNTIRTLSNAIRKYHPARKIRAQLIYIEAMKGKSDAKPLADCYCRNVTYIKIMGDHFSIMKGAAVQEIVRTIGEMLPNQ